MVVLEMASLSRAAHLFSFVSLLCQPRGLLRPCQAAA
jgi:hypothetical protein